jgi:hypothetical protein
MAPRVCQQPSRRGDDAHACGAWVAAVRPRGCATCGAWVAGRGVLAIVAAIALALATTACADDGGPRLDSVTPAAAARNAAVMIVGRRLCGVTGDCSRAGGEVQLGLEPPMVRAVVTSYSDTSATLVVPAAASVGKTVLIVTVNERSSNALDFEVLP